MLQVYQLFNQLLCANRDNIKHYSMRVDGSVIQVWKGGIIPAASLLQEGGDVRVVHVVQEHGADEEFINVLSDLAREIFIFFVHRKLDTVEVNRYWVKDRSMMTVMLQSGDTSTEYCYYTNEDDRLVCNITTKSSEWLSSLVTKDSVTAI